MADSNDTLPGIDRDSFEAAQQYCDSKRDSHTTEQTMAAMSAFGYGVAWASQKLEAENAKLREALEYYADYNNWDSTGNKLGDVIDESDCSFVEPGETWRQHGGRRAREALGKKVT